MVEVEANEDVLCIVQYTLEEQMYPNVWDI